MTARSVEGVNKIPRATTPRQSLTGKSAPPFAPDRRTSRIPSSQAPACPNSSICDCQLFIVAIQIVCSPTLAAAVEGGG